MNLISPTILRWTVIASLVLAVIGLIFDDALAPLIDGAIEWAALLGILAALLLIAGRHRAAEPATRAPIRTTVVRINVLVGIGIVGSVLLGGNAMAADPELLKVFAATALMLLKDIVQSEQ